MKLARLATVAPAAGLALLAAAPMALASPVAGAVPAAPAVAPAAVPAVALAVAPAAPVVAVPAVVPAATPAPTATHSRRPAPPRRPHPHRKPWPVTLTVRTVPALPGVRFAFDGKALTTNQAGVASYTAEHNFARHTLSLLSTSINQPARHYRFARWAGQRDPNQAFRTSVAGLPMRANYTITAAFTVQYPVTARLVDQYGTPLDLSRINSMTIKSDAGQILPFPKDQPIWLDGVTPAYRKSALVESDVYYSVQTLTMSGSNIVDAGRQRFTPVRGPTVTVTGQLHDLTITARDALFGDPLGTHAVVTTPEGRVLSVPFGPGHTATLRNLPRGTYHVTVAGTDGIVLDDQFTLSRDKALRVAVVSRGDSATMSAAVLLVAAFLLFAGRKRLRSTPARALARLAAPLLPVRRTASPRQRRPIAPKRHPGLTARLPRVPAGRTGGEPVGEQQHGRRQGGGGVVADRPQDDPAEEATVS